MPLKPGGRYRARSIKGGFQRLHFTQKGVVDEVKNLATGETKLLNMENPSKKKGTPYGR